MKYKIACKYCDNILCLFYKYFSNDICKDTSNDKNQIFYKKGENIIKIGQPVFGIYMIMEGAVKVITSSHNNKKTAIRMAKSGNFISYAVLSEERYNFDIVAIEKTSVCFIKKEIFENICRNNAEFTFVFLKMFAIEMFSVRCRMEYHSLMNTREKIAEAFLYAIEVFGLDEKSKTINVSITRHDIAELAATTTEQVTRYLSDFENEQLITRDKRSIHILNIQGFQDIIDNYIYN